MPKYERAFFYLTIAFMLLFLLVAVVNMEAERKADSLQEQVDSLKAQVQELETDEKTSFHEQDIKTALAYLQYGEYNRLKRYCEINSLDYGALLAVLVKEGHLKEAG